MVTGDARYSLSEQRIIRQQMAEVPVSLLVNVTALLQSLSCIVAVLCVCACYDCSIRVF